MSSFVARMRQRRVGGDFGRERPHCAIEVVSGNQAVDEAEALCFLARDQAAGEQNILRDARIHQVEQPGAGGRRQAVAERPGDRDAEARVGRGDAQVACKRDRAAAAGGHALHLRDGRLGHPLEPIEHAIEPLLVLHAVVSIGEVLKLCDVGAGDERLAAGAAQHQDAQRRVAVDALAGVDERLVHLPRHGVARVGTIEGQECERSVGLEVGMH